MAVAVAVAVVVVVVAVAVAAGFVVGLAAVALEWRFSRSRSCWGPG